MNDTSKKWLVILAFLLFSASLIGGFYLLMTPGETVNLAFAYVVGLSMIVLPCTLPLAFVIVPLAMGKGPKKGLLMSLFFGLGLAITLSIYGLFIAIIGKSIGLDQAVGSAGTVSRILFIIGGLSAFIFGLSELKLIKFSMPSYTGSYPDFITKQGDYLKAFFLGLFLGNAGVGCPNPLFYVLLGDIAVVGDMFNGWWLGFIHGIGRATPLIFLAILGILGVNAVSNIAKKTAVVTKWTGISLVLLGAFIFISGTSHQWYEETVVHKGWNEAVLFVTGEKSGIAEVEDHTEEAGTPKDHGHDNTAIQGLVASTSIETDINIIVGTSSSLIIDATNTEAVENATTKEPVVEEHQGGNDYIPAPWSWITLLLMIIIPLSWYKYRNLKLKD